MSKKIVNIFVDFSHIWMSLQEMARNGLNGGRISFRSLHHSIVEGREMGPYCAVYSSIPPAGQRAFFSGESSFEHRSYGMSGDYRTAIEEGSTMVRIGSLIFGPRNYV